MVRAAVKKPQSCSGSVKELIGQHFGQMETAGG